jgi:hypothetical protein
MVLLCAPPRLSHYKNPPGPITSPSTVPAYQASPDPRPDSFQRYRQTQLHHLQLQLQYPLPAPRSTMISKSSPSLLEQLEAAGVKVDVDSMDPKIAAGLPFTPHDMTSNQLLVNEQLQNPENKELVEKTIREMKGASWEDVHTVLVSERD